MDWTAPFHWFVHPRDDVFTLVPGRPLRLTKARSRRITCRCGRIWITAPQLLDDVFLGADEHWIISSDGLVLVEADAAAVVALDC